MSKTVLAEVDGFTPCIDTITQQYGIVVSAVFGKVWRYCQYDKYGGECTASIERIAQELKMGYNTVWRHIKLLVKDGYLEDLTPRIRNKPHSYKDTGKAGLEVKINARSTKLIEQVSQDGGARYPKLVEEDSIKIPLKIPLAHDKTFEETQEYQRPIPEEEAVLMDKEEYLNSVRQALDKSIMKEVDGIDLADYPPDVAATIGLVCKLWHLRPPRRSKKKGGTYATWIEAARDLNEACGEFGLKAIEAYREYFEQQMAQHQGVAPFTVNGPMSLVNSVRGHAGRLRETSQIMANKPPEQTQKWLFGDTVYEVTVGKDGKPLSVGNLVSP